MQHCRLRRFSALQRNSLSATARFSRSTSCVLSDRTWPRPQVSAGDAEEGTSPLRTHHSAYKTACRRRLKHRRARNAAILSAHPDSQWPALAMKAAPETAARQEKRAHTGQPECVSNRIVRRESIVLHFIVGCPRFTTRSMFMREPRDEVF